MDNTLKEDFLKLKNLYSHRDTTAKHKMELLQSMKNKLKEMNAGQDKYTFKTIHAGNVVSIENCNNPSDIYEIFGDMSEDTSSKKLSEFADKERSNQTSQNKYSKDNPYPHK